MTFMEIIAYVLAVWFATSTCAIMTATVIAVWKAFVIE